MFAAANPPLFTQAFYQEPVACLYPDEPDSFGSGLSYHRRSSVAEVNPFEDSFTSFLNSSSRASRASTPIERPSRSSSFGDRRSNSERAETLLKNRRAAAKCRQRKKEWLEEMSRSVQLTEFQNTRLEAQVSDLKEEIINIRMILASHNCPLDY